MTAQPEPSTDGDRATIRASSRLWLDVSLWIAAVPFAAAGVRVLLYSGGDPTLLRVLIETLDVVTIVLGTLLPVLPLLVGAAIYPLLIDLSLTRRLVTSGSPTRRWGMLTLIVAALAFWVALSPWPSAATTIAYLAVGVALGVILTYLWTFARWLTAGYTVRRSILEAFKVRVTIGGQEPVGKSWHVIAIAGIFLILTFATSPTMWLPQENIVTSTEKISGYVLQATEEWTTILSVDKQVTIVKPIDVSSREVCGQGEYSSLITVLWGNDHRSGPQCAE